MNTLPYIAAIISRIDNTEFQPVLPPAPGAIEHISTEAFSRGTVEMAIVSGNGNRIKYISIPVVVGFLFTCIKGIEELFTPYWNASLS